MIGLSELSITSEPAFAAYYRHRFEWIMMMMMMRMMLVLIVVLWRVLQYTYYLPFDNVALV